MQPLQFLAPIYQLTADLALFAASFTMWQLVGLAIVCSVFLVELVYNCIFDSDKNKVSTESEAGAYGDTAETLPEESDNDNEFQRQKACSVPLRL